MKVLLICLCLALASVVIASPTHQRNEMQKRDDEETDTSLDEIIEDSLGNEELADVNSEEEAAQETDTSLDEIIEDSLGNEELADVNSEEEAAQETEISLDEIIEDSLGNEELADVNSEEEGAQETETSLDGIIEDSLGNEELADVNSEEETAQEESDSKSDDDFKKEESIENVSTVPEEIPEAEPSEFETEIPEKEPSISQYTSVSGWKSRISLNPFSFLNSLRMPKINYNSNSGSSGTEKKRPFSDFWGSMFKSFQRKQ